MTEPGGMPGLAQRFRPPHGHAMILNEYDGLWFNRDGSPTKITKPIYDYLLGPEATGEERLALSGYVLGG